VDRGKSISGGGIGGIAVSSLGFTVVFFASFAESLATFAVKDLFQASAEIKILTAKFAKDSAKSAKDTNRNPAANSYPAIKSARALSAACRLLTPNPWR
jgi:hypothetical protein